MTLWLGIWLAISLCGNAGFFALLLWAVYLLGRSNEIARDLLAMVQRYRVTQEEDLGLHKPIPIPAKAREP